jgi:hypothetical protein
MPSHCQQTPSQCCTSIGSLNSNTSFSTSWYVPVQQNFSQDVKPQEAEIRRIVVWSQPGQIVCETLSRKNPHHKKRSGGVAEGVGPEFKAQYRRKKKKLSHPKSFDRMFPLLPANIQYGLCQTREPTLGLRIVCVCRLSVLQIHRLHSKLDRCGNRHQGQSPESVFEAGWRKITKEEKVT